MRHIIPLLLALILFSSVAAEQHYLLSSRLWEQAVRANQGTGPTLLVVYPEDGKETDAAQLRYCGQVDEDASLSVNDRTIKVYSGGLFAGLLKLPEPGTHEFTFTASNDQGTTSVTRTVVRLLPPSTLPSLPLRFDEDKWLEPSKDMVVGQGEIIEVRFKGSPGHTAWFKVAGKRGSWPMSELPAEETNGLGGVYAGSIEVRQDDDFQDSHITVYLDKKGWGRAKKRLPGRISVQSPDTVRVIQVEDEYTPLYTNPTTWIRLGHVPEGVRMRAVGMRGDRIRVQLAPSVFAWVSKQDISPLPEGAPPPHSNVGAIGSQTGESGTTLTLSLTTRLPFVCEEYLEPPRLVLKVFGGLSETGWITYRGDDRVVKSLKWSQPQEGIYQLCVDLKLKRIWGYRLSYKGNTLMMFIKNRPQVDSSEPLRGLVICLDPGHGGEHLGALGSSGLFEKDINLYMSFNIKRLLEEKGARVVLTRQGDETLSLADRVKIAHRCNADIFVSVHNNSIGWNVNPERPRGTSTFYYHPQSRELCSMLLPHLSGIAEEVKEIAYVMASFFVLRQHQRPAVLLEGLFMSHPEDELLLVDKEFEDAFARAVVTALEEYMRENGK